MKTPMNRKSTTEEIRARFDDDVERFSNLETGQAVCSDAPLAMELITKAALTMHSTIDKVLNIGCGAGNNSLKLRLEAGYDFDVNLVDLSRPMLERARERIQNVSAGHVKTTQVDFREAKFATDSFDVIIAAAVLHHSRDDEDWSNAFQLIYRWLKPGGSFG